MRDFLPDFSRRRAVVLILLGVLWTPLCLTAEEAWPVPERSHKPWTYWWIMGSALDHDNVVRELERFREAGLGGVHLIPIYGAKGFEERYIEFLSPHWMDTLQMTVREAEQRDLGVDLTLGSGWCFGGPWVSDKQANARTVGPGSQ